MSDPRITEERLRNYLDSNQVMRERLCLALLPLLGAYTREQPRRPKGGPDGTRDIEAIYQGATPIWGAVGFRNGGGADDAARNWAEEKFRTDVNGAYQENPSLVGFVFFTNVDLTPSRKTALLQYAQRKGIKIIDIFDMERLRHVLDSPEGLISRLQYLDIPMSATEQIALVGKFGNQLQQAVTARFDRVERTLAKMERFLDFHKPLFRLDIFAEFSTPITSAAIGDEALLLNIEGLHDLSKVFSCLCINNCGHKESARRLVSSTRLWHDDAPSKILRLMPSLGISPRTLTSYSELSLTTGGKRVTISDLTNVHIEVFCSQGFCGKINRVSLDVNGYELFSCLALPKGEEIVLKWPEKLDYNAVNHKWFRLAEKTQRNLLFDPPKPSGRFLPLQRLH